MKWQNKLQKFMYGRYGVDDLYKFLFGLYFVIIIIDLLFNIKFLVYLELIIIFVMFYRFFSRNIYKRSKENQKYISLRNKVIKPFINIKRNFMDKDHIYKKCSKCKTTLKLPIPYERGIKHTKCPKCKKRLTLFIWKKQKIEIIRN